MKFHLTQNNLDIFLSDKKTPAIILTGVLFIKEINLSLL